MFRPSRISKYRRNTKVEGIGFLYINTTKVKRIKLGANYFKTFQVEERNSRSLKTVHKTDTIKYLENLLNLENLECFECYKIVNHP